MINHTGMNLLFAILGALPVNMPLGITYPYCYSGCLVSSVLHDFTAETTDTEVYMFTFLLCVAFVFGVVFAPRCHLI